MKGRGERFSEMLRRLILSRGLNAHSCAKLAGVDPSAVHRFLKSERGLTTATVDAIVDALDLRLMEIADRSPRRQATGRKGRRGATA